MTCEKCQTKSLLPSWRSFGGSSDPMKSFISLGVSKSWVRPRFAWNGAVQLLRWRPRPASSCHKFAGRVLQCRPRSSDQGLVPAWNSASSALAIVGFRLDRRSVLICLFRFADRKVFVELHRRSLEDVRYSSFKRCFS